MKNKTFQLFTIFLAFCLGIAINYSCGTSQSDDSSVSYLWNQVKEMQNEIKQLKAEIASIKNGGSPDEFEAMQNDIKQLKAEIANIKNGDSSGEFQIDGLWFSRNGLVMSKQKELVIYQYVYTPISYTYTSNSTYEYDNYGRVTGLTGSSYNSYTDTTTESSAEYQYNDKTVTFTSYDKDGNITSKQTSTYY